MRICFFLASAVCFSGPVCFFGRTDARFPGRSLGGQPAWGEKSRFGLAQKAFSLSGCPAAFFFSLGHLFFFWPDGRTLHGEGAFVFFLRLWFVFLGLFFFRTDGRTISWLGPGRQTSNQIHVPLINQLWTFTSARLLIQIWGVG